MAAGKIQEEKVNRDGLKGGPQMRALTSSIVLQDQGGTFSQTMDQMKIINLFLGEGKLCILVHQNGKTDGTSTSGQNLLGLHMRPLSI